MSGEKLSILVTSGGTISKIDDVRCIGNLSKGTTGALIAEEFLKKGDIVHYMFGGNAARPLRKNLTANPHKKLAEEIEKVKKAYCDFRKYSDNLKEYPFLTFDDYSNRLKTLLEKEKIDVVVLAAAVSDYSAKQTAGKISSDLERMSIELERNPKIISLIKKWNPRVFQVGFKLLPDSETKEMVETAYKHGTKSNSDLTVANTINPHFSISRTAIITSEKKVYEIDRQDLAEKLVELVHERAKKNR